MEDAPDVSFNPSTGVASGFDPYDYNLFIYNRWGELIFESKDANFGWDGTYGIGGENRAVQDGTYTYQIIYKLKNNDFRSTIHGHVNVIR
jgi:gliding motility-associated-like protein